jgi:hypothetical protein
MLSLSPTSPAIISSCSQTSSAHHCLCSTAKLTQLRYHLPFDIRLLLFSFFKEKNGISLFLKIDKKKKKTFVKKERVLRASLIYHLLCVKLKKYCFHLPLKVPSFAWYFTYKLNLLFSLIRNVYSLSALRLLPSGKGKVSLSLSHGFEPQRARLSPP